MQKRAGRQLALGVPAQNVAHLVPQQKGQLVPVLRAQLEQRLRDEDETPRQRIGIGYPGADQAEVKLAPAVLYGIRQSGPNGRHQFLLLARGFA